MNTHTHTHIYIYIYIYIYIVKGHSINTGNFGEKSKINFFLRIFSQKSKLCIVWNWFIAKIILISQKYLF